MDRGRSLVQCFILWAALLIPLTTCAQQAVELEGEDLGADIAVRAFWGEAAEKPVIFQATWQGVSGAAPVFHLHLPGSIVGDATLMLDRLVEAGIAAYLDTRIHFTRQGVAADLPPEQIMYELDAMVTSACEEFGAAALFPGFSEPSIAQLGRLLRLDWSRAVMPVDGTGEPDKYLAIYRYVRGQREELERSMRADLLPLATIAVLAPGSSAMAVRAPIRINSTCGTVFDEENFLCALDLRLADAGATGIDPRPDTALYQAIALRAEDPAPVVEPAMRMRKRDRWLKGELDQINARLGEVDQRKELWALRDRLDDMEDRITGLDLEMRRIGSNDQSRNENPIAGLSALTGRNITVHFARHGVVLDAASRLLLNEVFEQMARSPADKVLITGYSDRSGDPALNLRLSEQRALSVRNYLLQRGIAEERLMINFYGDSRSTGRNQDERRVELEWLR